MINTMSNMTYNIAGAVGSAGMGLGGLDTISIGGSYRDSRLHGAAPYVNIALIRAHGGTIVQCRTEEHSAWAYHVIPEGVENFDTELGKIISMTLVKA